MNNLNNTEEIVHMGEAYYTQFFTLILNSILFLCSFPITWADGLRFAPKTSTIDIEYYHIFFHYKSYEYFTFTTFFDKFEI